MKINISLAHETDLTIERIQEFYALYWPKKTALLINEFYQWQYINTPEAKNLDHSYVAIDQKNQTIIGVMGVVPRQCYINCENIYSAEITSWMIHPNYRGKGLGSYFIEKLHDKFHAIFGMGTTEMVMPLYYQSGFRYIKAIPRYVKVINWEAVTQYSQITPAAIKMDKYWREKNIIEEYQVLPINDFNIDKINHNNRSYFNYMSRDAAYMDWRCANHPVYSHKYFIISKSGNINDAVLISLREESVANARILHVLDCIGDSSSLFSAVYFIEQYAKDLDFDAIDFYCTSSIIGKYFLGRGWFSMMDDELIKMPHLFHPIELKNPCSTSLIYWTKNHMDDLCDLSRLYITKQDVDFDRPTYAVSLEKYS